MYTPFQYQPAVKKPIPPPDKNWVDHVQENRKYLKVIQKVKLNKGFEGLADPMLFLMEVSAESLEFNKEVEATLSYTKQGVKLLKLFVKFLDLLFLDLNDKMSNGLASEVREVPAYSDLFQVMFTHAVPLALDKRSSSIDSEKGLESRENELKLQESTMEIKEEKKDSKDTRKSGPKTASTKKYGPKKSKSKKEGKLSKDRSIHKTVSKERISSREAKLNTNIVFMEDGKEIKETEHKDHPRKSISFKEDQEKKVGEETDEVSPTKQKPQGKAALIVMDGLGLIRSLQEHPIHVKVVKCEEGKDDKKEPESVTVDKPVGTTIPHTTNVGVTPLPAAEKKPDDSVLGTASIRVPESLRKALLTFTNNNTPLPARETHTDTYKLVDSKKVEVGKLNVTVTLTCFGKAVENCLREDTGVEESGYVYEHTKCWRTFAEAPKAPIITNPRLALHMMKAKAAVTPREWNSQELLRYGVGWGMVKAEEDERRRALGNDCQWLRLVKLAKGEVEKTRTKEPTVLPKNRFTMQPPVGSSAAAFKGPYLVASKSIIRTEPSTKAGGLNSELKEPSVLPNTLFTLHSPMESSSTYFRRPYFVASRASIGKEATWEKGESKAPTNEPSVFPNPQFPIFPQRESGIGLHKIPYLADATTLPVKQPGAPIALISQTVIWSNYNIVDNMRPINVEAIKQKTEHEHLKDLWVQQRIINKRFKEEQQDRINRKNSLHERFEQLKAGAPVTESEKLDEAKECSKSSQEDIKRSISPEVKHKVSK